MYRLGIGVARFTLSAWVGAAALFVVTGIREVRSPLLDSYIRDVLVEGLGDDIGGPADVRVLVRLDGRVAEVVVLPLHQHHDGRFGPVGVGPARNHLADLRVDFRNGGRERPDRVRPVHPTLRLPVPPV